MSTLVTIILPLFLIVLAGYVAGAGKWLDIAAAKAIARFVFLFAMPIAIINFYTGATPPGIEVVPLFAGYFLAMVMIIALAAWSGQKLLGLGVRDSGAHAFVSTCGNAVFLGLPIALQVEGWGQPFLMLMILEGIFVFGIATTLMQWDSDQKGAGGPLLRLLFGIGRSITTPFKNPVVIASLVGVVIAYTGFEFPMPMQTFFDLFGRTAGPTGLFVLGLYIATLPRAEVQTMLPNIGAVSVLKLLAFPALTAVCVHTFTDGDMVLTGAAVLFTAMPPAIAAIVQASHYQLYEKQTAAAVSVGSMLSLVTLVVVLILFA